MAKDYRKHWNRCDACGKFIAFDDFDNGAVRYMVTPDTGFTSEEFETLCIEHANIPKTIVVNKYKEPYDIYIGRPSIYGNPYSIGKDGNRTEVIEKFKKYFYDRIRNDEKFYIAVWKLYGKRLGCFCKPNPCHGDVYVEYFKKSFGGYKYKG